jgi:hypothetical protein
MCSLVSRLSIVLALFVAPSFSAVAEDLPSHHSADTNFDSQISLSELLRAIQFFNVGRYSCDPPGAMQPSEDGYLPGAGDESCKRHDTDYLDPPWQISLSELLRLIQIFNARAYGFDPNSEDGFIPIFTPEDNTATIQGENEDLRKFIAESNDDDLDDETKEALEDILLRAELAFLQEDRCEAADILDEGLELTQERRGAAAPEGPLETEIAFARIRELQHRILVTDEAGPVCPGRERENQEPEYEVEESTAMELVVVSRFGAARFKPTHQRLPDGSRQLFTQLILPGIDEQGGQAGYPGIPCVRQLVAVPPGAFVQLFEESAKIAETRTIKLTPYREDPLDQIQEDQLAFPDRELFADRPFVINENIYGADRFYPEEPCNIQPLGKMRGLEVYLLESCAGQYNPITQELRLFEEMELRVAFSNGPEGFAVEHMFQPFESNPDLFLSSVVNSAVIPTLPSIPELVQPSFVGEELIILTHPNFREAADRLADWKKQKGIVTTVFECGTGSGVNGRQTAAEIKQFIEDRYETALVKASYILLMGDAEFIPTHYQPRAQQFAGTSTTIGTDHPYAVIPVTIGPFTLDLLPTFALGRIPVDTLAQADAVVDKIIAYESNPPTAPASQGFYRRIMLAAQFQCCRTDVTQDGTAQRTFTEVSEFVRPSLVARGYNAHRLYRRTIDNGCAGCNPPRPAYTGDATPRRYYDGTPLPTAIGPASSFPWNAGTNDVINLFNEGVVLAFHRDHGAPSGWGTPSFRTNNLPLNNGVFQPVIFSVNCSSGVFDNETSGGAEGVFPGGVYWAEAILRQANGGAIGVIGDTRVSPSWTNSALSRGLFDAVFPEVLPGFGSSTPHRRLGDILNHAKLYLLTQIGSTFIDSSSVRDMFFLYHVLGDPTLEMWTDAPGPKFDFPIQSQVVDQSSITLNFATTELAGAEITLYQPLREDGFIPVGRGILAGDGSVTISPFQSWNIGDEVSYALNRENEIAIDGSVLLNLQ